MSSPDTRSCPRCQRALPAGHAGGNCPACLLASALTDEPAAAGWEDAAGEMPRELGGYEILAEVGRGGSGVVYRARQRGVNRVVALKTLHGPALGRRDAYERLRVEAEAVGRLEHPHIVPLYEVGRHAGTHFLTLRYFEHGSLADALKHHRFTPTEAARLVATAARAVHHAHQRGVLHRDLKPSNLLLDEHGEPHVADFGLAKLADDDRSLTLSTSVLGTPAYMAPEQASGRAKAAGTPADIYALGAILFELLAGRPPFVGASALEVLRLVADTEPPSPRALNPAVDRDLAAVCLRCLEKEPDRRYASAAGLANDLERWLNHEPPVVRPGTAGERFGKWVRRRPLVAGLTGLVTLAVLAGVGATLWQWSRARVERTRAVASERHARDLLYAANLNLAQADWEAGHPARVRRLLRETAAHPGRGFEWFHWQRRTHQEERILWGHAASVSGARFSPDGRRVATASEDHTVRVWDAATGQELLVLPHPEGGMAVEFSPDGQRLVTGASDGRIRLWSVAEGRLEREWAGHTGPVSARFSPDGRRVATAGWDSQVKLWDAGDGRLLGTGQGDWGRVKCLAFTPDGEKLVTGGEDSRVRFWDARTGAPLGLLTGHGRDVNGLAVSADGRWLATASYDGTARLWSLPKAELARTLRSEGGVFAAIAFSPDGRRVATATAYGSSAVRVWEARTGDPLFTLSGHDDTVWSVEFSPDGTRLVTASQDGTARIWDAAGPRRPLGRPGAAEPRLTLSPAGDRLLWSGAGEPALLYDTTTGAELRHFPGARAPQAFSLDGRLVALGAEDGGPIRILAAASGEVTAVLAEATDAVLELAFAPEGKHLLTAGPDGGAVWTVADGQLLRRLPEVRPPVHFGPRPGQLVTGTTNGLLLWESLAGPPRAHWPGAQAPVACSRDGRWIATATAGAEAVLWNAAGREHRRLPLRKFRARALALSPDGSQLAVGAAWWGSSITLWEVATGRPQGRLEGHAGFLHTVGYSSDGRRPLSASEDGTARLWEVASGRELLSLGDPASPSATTGAFWTGADDAEAIVTFHADGTARRWDRATVVEVASWTAAEQAHERRMAAGQPQP